MVQHIPLLDHRCVSTVLTGDSRTSLAYPFGEEHEIVLSGSLSRNHFASREKLQLSTTMCLRFSVQPRPAQNPACFSRLSCELASDRTAFSKLRSYYLSGLNLYHGNCYIHSACYPWGRYSQWHAAWKRDAFFVPNVTKHWGKRFFIKIALRILKSTEDWEGWKFVGTGRFPLFNSRMFSLLPVFFGVEKNLPRIRICWANEYISPLAAKLFFIVFIQTLEPLLFTTNRGPSFL